MMFNGLVMCTDSDSDFTKESIGRSSEVDSPSSTCASARAQYYQNKLLATLQVLQNKEETVRVQTESLAVAEARIASLTARSVELKRQIERKERELKTLRETIQKRKIEKNDVSITAQIQGDCTCGLEEENRKLRQNNEAMERQIEDLRKKTADFEIILENKETSDRQLQNQIITKENELHLIRQQLAAVECDTRERGQTCETVNIQLHQTQVLLEDKTAELTRVKAQCQQHEDTIRRLTEELDQTKEISQEYCALRGSTCAAQRKVRVLRAELAKALKHCEHLDACRRSEVSQLEAALCEAQARGAALCAEARRAARSVRAWTRHSKEAHREQDTQLKQQKSQIRLLEHRLEQAQNDSTLTRGSENLHTCTKCISARSINSFETNNKRSKSTSFERNAKNTSEEPSCSKCPRSGGSFKSVSLRTRQGRECAFETSASEIDSSSPPVSPQWPSRLKRFFCENGVFSSTREASVQMPERRDAATGSVSSIRSVGGVSGVASREPCDCRRCHVAHVHVNTMPRGAHRGSMEEVLTRVESAGAALSDSLRRWHRRAALHRT